MEKPLFIFDFDGTLADTRDLMVDIGNRYALEIGEAPLSEEDIRVYREEGAGALIKRRGLLRIGLLRLLKRGGEMFAESIDSIKMVQGVDDALNEIGSKDIILAIVTSNAEERVRQAMKDTLLAFSGVFSEKNLFGKAAKLKKVVKKFRANPQNTFYIGDEQRDIIAAKEAGVHPIGVAWGFGEERSLVSSGAEKILRTPKEIVTLAELSSRQDIS